MNRHVTVFLIQLQQYERDTNYRTVTVPNIKKYAEKLQNQNHNNDGRTVGNTKQLSKINLLSLLKSKLKVGLIFNMFTSKKGNCYSLGTVLVGIKNIQWKWKTKFTL